jgi:hypothetical protein
MVSTGGPKSIGPGARWGCPGGLGWFRAGGDTHKVGTQSGSDRQSWSTIGTRESCAPSGLMGFKDSCTASLVLGIEGLVAFGDSPPTEVSEQEKPWERVH